MRRNVTFKSNGLKVAGHLFIPNDYKAGERRSAIVISHPFGGVKEQTAGLYAWKLSEKGFIALAFDASYQGEKLPDALSPYRPWASIYILSIVNGGNNSV